MLFLESVWASATESKPPRLQTLRLRSFAATLSSNSIACGLTTDHRTTPLHPL